MIQQLVVNGCSYMDAYASGNGQVDLAKSLSNTGGYNIPIANSIAVSGSANSRILRTTIKHSYQAQVPTLYVLGMTFVSRVELPILDSDDEFEGRWTNPQNQMFVDRWQYMWKQKDTDQFVELKLKSEFASIVDRTEDLMYHMIGVIADLKRRGHRVLMYQQADNLYLEHLDNPRLSLFKEFPEIIGGFKWRAIGYQHQHGVKPMIYPPGGSYVPPEMTHRLPGEHQLINDYLTNYIQEHKILE